MSESGGNDLMSEAARRFTEGQNQFTKMWSEFAGKMATSGVSFSPESAPPETARRMRSAFFQALSDYCEQHMRSPEFLDSWKQTIDGAIQFRRQMNESLGKMHHELQGTSRQDIDQLMVALTHVERRLVDTVERVGDQVEGLAKRVESLEKKAAVNPAPHRPSTATKKVASAKKKAPAKKKVAAVKKKRAGGNR